MMMLKIVALVSLCVLPAMAAPCGPETLIWLGKKNIEGSKMEFPPTDGVCYPITNDDAGMMAKMCGPGSFTLSPYSCANHGKYATGDINKTFKPGDACATIGTARTKFDMARAHSGGGSYTVHC